jgi:hypothetical protein
MEFEHCTGLAIKTRRGANVIQRTRRFPAFLYAGPTRLRHTMPAVGGFR